MNLELRPEVAAFAQLMEMRLRKNDSRGGWKDCTVDYLMERLEANMEDLKAGDRIGRTLGDIGNFAMMLADVSDQLPKLANRPAPLPALAQEPCPHGCVDGWHERKGNGPRRCLTCNPQVGHAGHRPYKPNAEGTAPGGNEEVPGKWSRKPSIEELRAILNREEDEGIVILPNGEVRAASDALLEFAVQKQREADQKANRPAPDVQGMPEYPKRYDLEMYTAPNSEGDFCGMEENDNGDWVDRQDYFKLWAYASQLKAALTAPESPAPSREGWQPIETAPKDGTQILVYAHGTYREIVRYHAGLKVWLTNEHKQYDGATHWQPLPAPPEVK